MHALFLEISRVRHIELNTLQLKGWFKSTVWCTNWVHKSQHTREEIDQEAWTGLEDVKEKLEQLQYSQEFVLNMDQIAVYFSMRLRDWPIHNINSSTVPMLLGMIMEASNKSNKSMIEYYLDPIMRQ